MTAFPRAPAAGDVIRLVAVGGLTSLAFALPFEVDRPWLRTGPIQFTNVELLLVAALGTAWLAAGLGRAAARGAPGARTPAMPLPRSWLVLWGLFGAALLISAWFAPEFRGNAIKGALRGIAGLVLAATVATVCRRRDVLWLLGGACAGGLLSAAIGTAEILAGEELGWLSPLRPRPTRVGPFLRLTGTFDYANTAAMYIEATSPLLVAAGWAAWVRRPGRGGARVPVLAGLAVGLALYVQAAILTYSRAAVTSLFLAALVVGVLARQTAPARRPARVYLGLSGLAAGLLAANLLLNPVVGLRFGTGGPGEWYRAGLEAPDTLEVTEAGVREVPIRVVNRGTVSWSDEGPHPIRLGARWVRVGDGAGPVEELRWPLPAHLAPGESVRLRVPLRAPATPGSYELRWDLIQEGVAWFSERAGAPERSLVRVRGEETLAAGGEEAVAAGGEETVAAGAARTSTGAWVAPAPASLPTPGRATLWRVALAEFSERPWLGIGMDNFRRVYGRGLGRDEWDQTVHTNNWYLEILVSAGLVGALPFAAWLLLLVADVFGVLRRGGADILQLGVAVALLSYLIHGLLDYFLAFHSTGLLFWILVGVWGRLRPGGAPKGALA